MPTIAAAMTADVDTLFATPDQHFLSFDGDSALFLAMDRPSYHRSAFLDGRAVALSPTPLRRPLGPLLDRVQGHDAPRTGWIFHIARCGSTLLSRIIDSEKGNLILREPPPLRQVGLDVAATGGGGRWHDRLRLAHAMAARRFDPDLPTVVKANVPVNFMLEQVAALDEKAPSILLHFALKPYLLAILRAPPHRLWVERITDQLGPALANRVGFRKDATIAERAAALWLAQMLAFHSVLGANPAARSLDSDQLFASPADSGKAAAEHLGVRGADIEANVATLATSYSKDLSKPFDEASRRRREADDRLRLERELVEARRWLDSCAAAQHLPQRLGQPLIGDSPVLLD